MSDLALAQQWSECLMSNYDPITAQQMGLSLCYETETDYSPLIANTKGAFQSWLRKETK
jgi:hypothetical protein